MSFLLRGASPFTSDWRAAGLVALGTLWASACFDFGRCSLDEDACDGDYSCGANQICEDQFFSGRSCIPADVCTTTAACLSGETCVPRDSQPADNPFEGPRPGKSVCECLSASCEGPAGSGGSGNAGGAGGAGADGGAAGSGGVGGGP